jgi:ComF family protein
MHMKNIPSHVHEGFFGVTTLLGNALFPPTCLLCDTTTDTAHTLCNACFHAMQMISDPCCARCSHPFEYAMDWADAPCPSCADAPTTYDAARAVWRYDAYSTRLIRKLKYADQTHLAPYLARVMAGQGVTLLEHAQILAPVPLHPRRLLHRRYNQSMLLARGIARNTPHLTLMPALLQRTRHTPPQTTLSQAKRKRNVAGVFRVHPRTAAYVQGAHILLIDDVMTTGATLNACASVLKNGGAAWVGVLTLAKRVLGDREAL